MRFFLPWLNIKLGKNIKIKKLLPGESSLVILISVNYFFFKNPSTSSGDMILSTKVYAPVLGDFTILIAFVNLLEAVCKVATVFFAMIYKYNEIIIIPNYLISL